MSPSVDRIKALKVEIASLEFQKEIFMHSEWGMDIKDFSDEIETRDVQLAQFRDRLDKLMSSQPATDGAAFDIHDHQTYPIISRLPHEMLSTIFKHGPTHPSSRMHFALSISQVSRYWRGTAMQTPFLWSGIYLLPWRTGRGYRKFVEVLVERSHSHPLDIAIRLNESDDPRVINKMKQRMAFLCRTRESRSPHPTIPTNLQEPETHCLQAQLDIVIPKVSRWRSFTYHCDHPDEVFEITERLAHFSATILESFDLKVTFGEEEDDSEDQSCDIFQGGAPLLTQIRINGVKPILCLPPLSSVTSLRLGEGCQQMDGEEFLLMLQFAPCLVSLNFDGTVVEPEDLYELALLEKGIEIVTLRSFSFSANASPKYVIDGVLNAIRCPALESLTISGLDAFCGIQPVELLSTTALPTPPFPMLQSLKLYGINCAEFAEHVDFTHLPAIDTISLTDCTSPMAFLRFLLLSRGESGGVWPVLRVITLSHLGPEELDGLRTIILHRRAYGKPIKAVLLDPDSINRFSKQVEVLKQHVAVQRGERVYYCTLPQMCTK